MQLILMFVGLFIGAVLDSSFTGSLLGALAGLAMGQAIRLVKLGYETRTQRELLTSTRATLAQVSARLHVLEAANVPPVAVPPPLSVAPQAPDPQATADRSAAWASVDASPADAPEAPAHSAWYTTAEPRETVSVAAPAGPGPISRTIASARQWLLGGNTVLRVGVVLLFIGLAFLLRYASETYAIPVQARYVAVALAALALLVLGWRIYPARAHYGLILQGAGVAVLYLTIFAAMSLDALLPPMLGMVLMVGIVVLSGVLAVLQNAMTLACVAALGGFAAPLLASGGHGSHIGLFTYFAVLDCGILGIAWFRAWRPLNLIGFTGTFALGFAWGLRSYTPALFWSTETFLLLFFFMYLAIGLLFARRRLLDGAHDGQRMAGYYVDGSLLFGPPLAGFALQCVLVQDIDLGTAFSALGLAAIYLGLAWVLRRSERQRITLLIDTCLAIGVIFASLAIPLALDNTWTSAAWAVEGAGLLWLGLRQQRLLARLFAVLLQLGAALAYLLTLDFGARSLFLGSILGALLLGCALLFSFYRLHGASDEQIRPWEPYLLPPLACLGLGFVYLLSPLSFDYQGTTAGWAWSGLLTVIGALHLVQRRRTALRVQATTPASAAVPQTRSALLGTRSVLLCAVMIQVCAGALMLLFGQGLWGEIIDQGAAPFTSGDFLATFSLALAGLLAAWCIHRRALAGQVGWRALRYGLLAWGALWWWLAFNIEVLRTAPLGWQNRLALLVAVLSVASVTWLAPRLRWPALAHVTLALIPVALINLALDGLEQGNLQGPQAVAVWALVFAVHFASLRRLQPLLRPRLAQAAHIIGCWTLIIVVALDLRELLLTLANTHNAWRWLGWALAPSLYLLAMAARRQWPWPVSAWARAYRWHAAWPVALALLVWFGLAAVFSDGSAQPLPYVVLVNPLELALLFALLALWRWSREGEARVRLSPRWQWLLGACAFAFATTTVMRAMHHWAAVPYDLEPLLGSMRVQAALSILWTVIALGLMVVGHRRQWRAIWLIGAALIAVVVAKLFLVELSNQGGLARIISFIGVGILLLVVGYFAPPVNRERLYKRQEN